MSEPDEYAEPEELSSRRPRRAARVPDDVAESIQARMAAMRVRHAADQHQCTARATGRCDHPNHRRDMDLLGEMLDTIGLSHDYPAYTPDEDRIWLRWVGQSGPAEEQAA